MAEQIIFERKLAKGFSSNVEDDGPLTSEIRYIKRKYTVKRRRLSSKPLKRDAISALEEAPFKRQRIYAVTNNMNSRTGTSFQKNSGQRSLASRQKTKDL